MFFAWLGYYLLEQPSAPALSVAAQAATDSDADGIEDPVDRCIAQAGPAVNAGCPLPARSTTAEQSARATIHTAAAARRASNDDPCQPTDGRAPPQHCNSVAAPSVAATGSAAATLPDLTLIDSDGDQVADLQDACPTLAGSLDNGGCPSDRDADGIADGEDRCPDSSGVAAYLGCPADVDNDGVENKLDACPDIAGDAAQLGCPADSDGDGVADPIDDCPQQAGTLANGCVADSDADGIPDERDACPQVSADGSADGCPADGDGDGVIDADDLCPDLAGSADELGCPVDGDPAAAASTDTAAAGEGGIVCRDPTVAADRYCLPGVDSDGDDVTDVDDLCVDVAGTADDLGCPASADASADGSADGSTATVTELPAPAVTLPTTNTEAEAQLSPADQQILDTAMEQVAFNSNSATLTPRSRDILNEVAKLMNRYPQATLEVSGRTDSSGRADRNMELSIRRASACATYLADQGIAVQRLLAFGYGESEPISSNATAAGRRINRRVEFNLKLR